MLHAASGVRRTRGLNTRQPLPDGGRRATACRRSNVTMFNRMSRHASRFGEQVICLKRLPTGDMLAYASGGVRHLLDASFLAQFESAATTAARLPRRQAAALLSADTPYPVATAPRGGMGADQDPSALLASPSTAEYEVCPMERGADAVAYRGNGRVHMDFISRNKGKGGTGKSASLSRGTKRTHSGSPGGSCEDSGSDDDGDYSDDGEEGEDEGEEEGRGGEGGEREEEEEIQRGRVLAREQSTRQTQRRGPAVSAFDASMGVRRTARKRQASASSLSFSMGDEDGSDAESVQHRMHELVRALMDGSGDLPSIDVVSPPAPEIAALVQAASEFQRALALVTLTGQD